MFPKRCYARFLPLIPPSKRVFPLSAPYPGAFILSRSMGDRHLPPASPVIPSEPLYLSRFRPFMALIPPHKKNGHKEPKTRPMQPLFPRNRTPRPPNQTLIPGNVRSMFARCSILHFLFVPSHLPISPLNSLTPNFIRLRSEHSVLEHFVFPPIQGRLTGSNVSVKRLNMS